MSGVVKRKPEKTWVFEISDALIVVKARSKGQARSRAAEALKARGLNVPPLLASAEARVLEDGETVWCFS